VTVQFRRAIVAEFADVKIEALQGEESMRVVFSVERDKLPWPNNAELAVYNLNPVTRSMLTSSGKVSAKISAGYIGDVNQIFFGVLDTVEHIRDGTNWVTRMSASDAGEKIKQARVSQTFTKGTTYLAIIKAILKVLGLGEGNLASFATSAELLRTISFAASLHGNAVEELTYFLRAANLEFSIQDGKVQFLRIGEGAPNLQGPLINGDHGMVGSPRIVREKATDLTRKKTKTTVQNSIASALDDDVDMITTVEGQCLLNARLVPGVMFRLESETINADWLACATKHVGDTHGQEWTTDFKGMPVA
jgi:hypothetical protein